MSKIEVGLQELHAGSEGESPMEDVSSSHPIKEPFARVTLVSPSSPADICVS